jgi:hypothetical protein
VDKPENIVGRDRQWAAVERFLFDGAPDDGPLRLGLVSGRRRTGKTQLLAAVCDAAGGLYAACVQDEGDRAARTRFATAIARHAGLTTDSGGGPQAWGSGKDPESWERLLRAALDTAARTAPPGMPPLVVIDEFPYLMANAPQLPSLIQHLYDDAQNNRGPGGRLILCGSALSVMHELLSGAKPLRGRAMMDMRLPALDYREAARLWGIDDPAVALRVHACVGGIPGYRPLIATTPTGVADFDRWITENLLAVDVSVFTRTEVDYLMREDPRISARALYYDILSAVAAGASTPTKIGTAIGRDDNAIRYPLGVLESTGYLTRTQDLLRTRKPVITVTDPVIRFDRLITAPNLGQLELGRAEQVWHAAAPTFRSNILGPHFEELARDWTLRFAPDELGRPTGLGTIGSANIHDHNGRAKHEIDVLATDGKHVTLLGEAKATLERRGLPDLERLDTIKNLLEQLGHHTTDAIIALFSTTGFTTDLKKTATTRHDVELIDLNRLYGR